MKKSHLPVLVFAVLLLFLIQSAGTLVESIYILDLLNTSLDEKALGILFFFSPLLALPFFRKFPRGLGWVLFALLFLGRGLTATLPTAGRLVSAGLAAGAAFGLLLLLQPARLKGEERPPAGTWAAGLALAVGLSALLRAAGNGIEYSLTSDGAWVGWLLGGLLGLTLAQVEWTPLPVQEAPHKPVIAPLLGTYLVIILTWFAFSAPAVIARWTQGNYVAMVALVSLLSLGWVWLSLTRPGWMDRISPRLLLVWNLLFTLVLTRTLLAGRVDFPSTLQSPPVVVGGPTFWQQMLVYAMLLLFPVIFVDLRLFVGQIQLANPSPRRLVPGILLGGLVLVLLVFINIFTNVWAYVPPISPLFRSLYWLPFFMLAGGISLLAWVGRRIHLPVNLDEAKPYVKSDWSLPGGLVVLLLATLLFAVPGTLTPPDDTRKTSLVAMTYNTQQFNTEDGEKSFDRQIALIQRANPDILALQESDSARISFNNNDYVRYFAEKLGYYVYYGPTPVTGTFGTAILSKYPLENPRSVFIFSDQDETGVAEAEVVIGSKRFTVYNVHPDSSDPAMLLFAQTVLERSKDKPYVIVLGDFNLRDTSKAYQLFDSVLVNAWTSVYPGKISPDGVDMSGRNRIDHIFTTPDLTARNPVYVLPPESFTDHPVHWTELYWTVP
jgi:endonuclease/exonuclease/phosphatase family metal-dependent hydrolase